MMGDGSMRKRFSHGQIGVVKLHILADQGNFHRPGGGEVALGNLFPVA